MPRRLKVYFARMGFYESVVAAPNQAEALKAWGVRQDLFATGEACVASDKNARAALAHPGMPLRRAIGADGAFSLDPAPPKAPAGPKPGRAATKAPKPPPDRSLLQAAEARLEEVDAERARAEADFRRRREALAAEETSARRSWAEARKAALRDVQLERRAYAKAGGKP